MKRVLIKLIQIYYNGRLNKYRYYNRMERESERDIYIYILRARDSNSFFYPDNTIIL